MAERFTADLLFILFVLLVAALLGFLIGWLLAKRRCRKQIAPLEEEIEGLKARIRKLEEEIEGFKARIRKLEDEKNGLNAQLRLLDDEKNRLEAQLNKAPADRVHGIADVPAAPVLPGFLPENIRPDDLEVVIGIGPKIARLLMNRGITTWKALSETAPNYLEAILVEDGGERFRIHNPASWPHQALLLHESRWDEFRELRDKLSTESR
jgi:predicted flap endonuclease-1-like 5' DNA nuclease